MNANVNPGLRLLLLEDSDDDALLIQRSLERHGFRLTLGRAQNEAQFTAALENGAWDVIVADFSLPGFSGIDALRLTRDVEPDLPFILVSGTIGEELAVAAMRGGAQDYVMKSNLARLGPAIERERWEYKIRLQRARDQQLLRESEERFRATFEQIAVGVVHLSVDGHCIRVNERFCTITGYTRETAVGRYYSTFLSERSHEQAASRFAELVAGRLERFATESRLVRADGSRVWVNLSASLTRVTGSGERYLVIVVEDISERRAAEDALRDSEARYRMLLEQASDGIFISDAEGRFLEVNDSAVALMRISREELLQLRVDDLIPHDDRRTHPLVYPRLNSGEVAVVSRTLRRSDGTTVDVEVSAKRLPDGRIQSIVRDITERVVSQEQLKLSEQRFRLISKATNDPIWDWKLDSGEVWWNESFFSHFGYWPHDVEGTLDWWVARVHPEDRDRIEKSLVAALDGEASLWSGEYRFRAADDHYRYVIDRGYISRDEHGKAMRMLGSMLDQTERRAAEDAVRASELRFRHVYESNMLGILFWNLDGTIYDANDAFLQMIGYTREDLLNGIDWRALTPARWRETDERAMDEIRATGRCAPFEKEYTRKDGSTVTVFLGATLFPDETESGVSWIADLTDRRRAENAMRESEERFRALIENASDVITVLDRAGVILYQSPTINRVLGYAAEEMVGQSAFLRIDPDDRQRVWQLFNDALASQAATAPVAHRMLHRNGSVRYMESTGRSLLDHPAIRGIVVTSRDVTERRAIETKLEQAQRLSSLGRLAASVAHEFNNVMMGIQAFGEVIERQAAEIPQLARASRAIQKSIDRGRRITQEILRFAQPAEPSLAPIDMSSWMRELDAELRGIVGERNELLIHVEPSLQLRGDVAQLSQVVTNLVLNARDAMPERGGTIRVIATAADPADVRHFLPAAGEQKFVHLTVADTGTGIPQEVLDRIFEPLFTTKRSGTGLGLAIAHQIIARHEGHVFVSSREGEGSQFDIFVPLLVAEPPRTAQQLQQAPAVEEPRNARVLLVEDDEVVSDGIAAILSLDGFDIRTATSAAECMVRLHEATPDVIVLDVGLPDGDGVELSEVIRTTHPDIPIVFSTGHGDEGRLDRLQSRERIAFLQKPYEATELERALQRVLER